jgi:hypothetical protein
MTTDVLTLMLVGVRIMMHLSIRHRQVGPDRSNFSSVGNQKATGRATTKKMPFGKNRREILLWHCSECYRNGISEAVDILSEGGRRVNAPGQADDLEPRASNKAITTLCTSHG